MKACVKVRPGLKGVILDNMMCCIDDREIGHNKPAV